jgi:hypothetical protein
MSRGERSQKMMSWDMLWSSLLLALLLLAREALCAPLQWEPIKPVGVRCVQLL